MFLFFSSYLHLDQTGTKPKNEIAEIFSDESKKLILKFEKQMEPDFSLRERANWYFEKAVELDFEGSRKR